MSTRQVDGIGTALTAADGKTLYFADQESSGQIRCTGDCVSIWIPLKVADGTAPTAGSGVTGQLATITRPDGGAQVTYDGKPLYTFAQDSGPGAANGNGVKDSFDGTEFVWHAAAPGGAAPAGGGGNPGGDGY